MYGVNESNYLISGGTYNQGGYGGPLNIPPSPATSNITSNPVDSLFGLRPRSGPAPGYSGHTGHSGHQQPGGQEMMFGLGNKTGGLDLGSNRLDLASNRLGLGGLGLG